MDERKILLDTYQILQKEDSSPEIIEEKESILKQHGESLVKFVENFLPEAKEVVDNYFNTLSYYRAKGFFGESKTIDFFPGNKVSDKKHGRTGTVEDIDHSLGLVTVKWNNFDESHVLTPKDLVLEESSVFSSYIVEIKCQSNKEVLETTNKIRFMKIPCIQRESSAFVLCEGKSPKDAINKLSLKMLDKSILSEINEKNISEVTFESPHTPSNIFRLLQVKEEASSQGNSFLYVRKPFFENYTKIEMEELADLVSEEINPSGFFEGLKYFGHSKIGEHSCFFGEESIEVFFGDSRQNFIEEIQGQDLVELNHLVELNLKEKLQSPDEFLLNESTTHESKSNLVDLIAKRLNGPLSQTRNFAAVLLADNKFVSYLEENKDKCVYGDAVLENLLSQKSPAEYDIKDVYDPICSLIENFSSISNEKNWNGFLNEEVLVEKKSSEKKEKDVQNHPDIDKSKVNEFDKIVGNLLDKLNDLKSNPFQNFKNKSVLDGILKFYYFLNMNKDMEWNPLGSKNNKSFSEKIFVVPEKKQDKKEDREDYDVSPIKILIGHLENLRVKGISSLKEEKLHVKNIKKMALLIIEVFDYLVLYQEENWNPIKKRQSGKE